MAILFHITRLIKKQFIFNLKVATSYFLTRQAQIQRYRPCVVEKTDKDQLESMGLSSNRSCKGINEVLAKQVHFRNNIFSL